MRQAQASLGAARGQQPRTRTAFRHKLATLLPALAVGCALTAGEPVSAQPAKPAPVSGKVAGKVAGKTAGKVAGKATAKATGKAGKSGKKAAAANRKPLRAAPPSALAPPASTVAPTVADCQAGKHTTALRALPPGAQAEHAQAVAFDRNWVRWPAAADNPPAADGRYVLVSDGQPLAVGQPLSLARVVASLPRTLAPLPAALTQSQPPVAPGVDLEMPAPAQRRWPALLRGPLQLVETDGAGVVRRHTGLQVGALLDDLFGAAAANATLGAVPSSKATTFAVWAPSAQRVNVCLYPPGSGTQANQASQAGSISNVQLLTLQRDEDSGTWRGQWPADLSGHNYTLLVDVQTPGIGMVRNQVTDPYGLSLNANGQRSWIGDLNQPRTKPAGWDTAARPSRAVDSADHAFCELPVRYFSVSDLGLLPALDFATARERGCITPPAAPQARNADDSPGYDRLQLGVPQRSQASDAEDGSVRVREFRSLVMALHAAGLHVGMQMAYSGTNTSAASRLMAPSVLDRIVPGYYQGPNDQRLNAQGATQRIMMTKLMVDTAVIWARDYRIDRMRLDPMGLQTRATMETLQAAVDRAAGRRIHLLGAVVNGVEGNDNVTLPALPRKAAAQGAEAP